MAVEIPNLRRTSDLLITRELSMERKEEAREVHEWLSRYHSDLVHAKLRLTQNKYQKYSSCQKFLFLHAKSFVIK